MSSQTNRRYLTIGQVAEAVTFMTKQRCTTAMIYHYERLGLIETPERSLGGFRLFSFQDVSRVAQIKRLQDEGLMLMEIREHLDLHAEHDLPDIDWPDQPVDRRIQILEAALRVFPIKGFYDTTLQDIAQEVGLSGPAIYQYFKSKEDLFLSLSESFAYQIIYEELTSPLQTKEDATLADIRQVLIDLGEAFLYITGNRIELMRMFISEARRYPEVGVNYVERQIAPVEARVAKFLDYYVAAGLLAPNDTLLTAHAFFGIFLNIVFAQNLMYAKHYLERPTSVMVSQLVDLFLNGLKKSNSL